MYFSDVKSYHTFSAIKNVAIALTPKETRLDPKAKFRISDGVEKLTAAFITFTANGYFLQNLRHVPLMKRTNISNHQNDNRVPKQLCIRPASTSSPDNNSIIDHQLRNYQPETKE